MTDIVRDSASTGWRRSRPEGDVTKVQADGIIQIGGLLLNAGLLTGVVIELRTAARVRSEDSAHSRMQVTLDAWRTVDHRLRETELAARLALGRYQIRPDAVRQFFSRVSRARGRLERAEQSDEPAAKEDLSVIEAYEAIRSALNALEAFCVAVELGAYDRAVAERVAGWRISRAFDRYRHYVSFWRLVVPDEVEPVYGAFERFAKTFLNGRAEGQRHVPWIDEADVVGQEGSNPPEPEQSGEGAAPKAATPS